MLANLFLPLGGFKKASKGLIDLRIWPAFAPNAFLRVEGTFLTLFGRTFEARILRMEILRMEIGRIMPRVLCSMRKLPRALQVGGLPRILKGILTL